ncbi:TetR/AcrR family transcriptional regulator [Chitinophaga pinensis]|uniref:Regulatory protein TetR n=1 Tax=Chitinophaga pinensis (strain ATCC 43595 / DSM 2588 / LMG 13176 / NBRC 15968 / NCIMB 11800 / UQM 2034) TaxID=485918 RepID=A0A979G3Z4_CHIPD|nr:TetR/AcrR family transcriptional regulator [Chitinophaga pinensis]ACU60163.1 regulatory protein TetR [Chitinophaga pinensis DSM 2588]
MEEQKNVRRRGDDLLESLYEVTMKLMEEIKPANITFQQIADAAKTSRSVLYRRWPTTFDLLQDIYTYKAKRLFEGDFLEEMKDTGSLRGDFIQFLTFYQQMYMEIGADVLNNYFYLRMQDKENNKEPVVHTAALDKYIRAMETLLEKAQSRGEKVKKVSKATLMLPFDMIRMENLVRPDNISEKRLESMVDEVLLPVFKA